MIADRKDLVYIVYGRPLNARSFLFKKAPKKVYYGVKHKPRGKLRGDGG